jgi:hypothetical protein
VSVTLVVAAGILGGCGVRIQDQPHAIERKDVPYGLLDEGTSGGADVDTTGFLVYFFRDDRLVAVPRSGESPASAEAVLVGLLRGPTRDEAAAGLRTSLPKDASLASVVHLGTVVVVDITGIPAAESGVDHAAAQVEATLQELEGITTVLVRFDAATVESAGTASPER